MIKFIYEHAVGPCYWEEEIDTIQYDKFFYCDEEEDKYYLYTPSTKIQQESTTFNLVPVYVEGNRTFTLLKLIKEYDSYITLVDMSYGNYLLKLTLDIEKINFLDILSPLCNYTLNKKETFYELNM